MPPTSGERTSVALFLFSLAVRPLPDSFDGADSFQLDRAEVGKLAAAANVPVGRNTLYAITVDIAESAEAVTADRFVGNNRHFIRLTVPDADAYSWTDEVLEDIDDLEDIDAAIRAAADAGFDVTSALPEALVLPLSLGAEEKQQGVTLDEFLGDVEDDDLCAAVVDDSPEEKCCTKCKTSKSLDDFPVRNTGRVSSWCRVCHRAATASWRRRNPGKSTSDSLNSYAARSFQQVVAAQPQQKLCSKCRRTQYANAFTFDRHRRDGLSAHCRVCRRNHRVTHPTVFTLPPIAHR